jgi:putative methylase
LRKAFEIAKIVYSFHKSESSDFLGRLAEQQGFVITHKWDFRWPLKATQKYHTRRILRIKVSCYRFEEKNQKFLNSSEVPVVQ